MAENTTTATVMQSDALTHHEQQMLTELDVLCGKTFELCEEGGKLRKKFNRANVRSGCQQLMHALARLGSEAE